MTNVFYPTTYIVEINHIQSPISSSYLAETTPETKRKVFLFIFRVCINVHTEPKVYFPKIERLFYPNKASVLLKQTLYFT